jgi:hypothetical protein
MVKYAVVKELVNQKFSWMYEPWIKKGVNFFNLLSEVPDDYVVVANALPWNEPLKSWKEAGKNFIIIEWGYWAEKPDPTKKSRIQTYRVSYNHSHNIKMKSVPYSRFHTLNPPPLDWRQSRGDSLLIIEPNENTVKIKKGISLEEWREDFLLKIRPFWDGPVRWRVKMGGAKPGRAESFRKDIELSHAVVGESTMACVEAVMLGCPAYTIDYSAVSPLMGTDLTVLKNPVLPDRTQWFEHIAWSQFHISEFASGTGVADMVEEYQILG